MCHFVCLCVYIMCVHMCGVCVCVCVYHVSTPVTFVMKDCQYHRVGMVGVTYITSPCRNAIIIDRDMRWETN